MMKTNFFVELTSHNKVEKVKLSKSNKHFILNLKIDAKLENDITKWNNYDRIKKLSDLYRKEWKSENKILNLDFEAGVENFRFNKLKFKNFG